jgi:hypothetical protein
MRLALLLNLSLIFLSFSACTPTARITKCEKSDWFSTGYDAATRGKTLGDLKFKCDPNEEQTIELNVGYQKGLSEFCSKRNGYAIGQAGSQPKISCPLILQPDFQSGLRIGQEVFQLRRERELLETQKTEIEDEIRSSTLSDIEENTLKQSLSTLNERQAKIEKQLIELTSDTL